MSQHAPAVAPPLQLIEERKLVTITRATLGAAVVAMLLTTTGLIAPQLSTSARATPATSAVVAPPSGTVLPPTPDRAVDGARRLDDAGQLDLYGNDVSEAVATYRLDADGSLYEAHSPQTQLPKLGSPKS